MKIKCFLLLSLVIGLQVKAAVNPIPNDPGTLEALIALHKQAAAAERNALQRIEASYGLQVKVKTTTHKLQEIREIIETKSSNLYSYVLLASRIAYIGNNLYKLSKSYYDFTSATTSTLFKKPMVAWYYAEAVSACAREVKNIKPLLARFTATNFLTASTMDDNLMILGSIQAAIDRCQHAIDEAYMWSSLVVNGGYTRLFLDDIFNSKLTDQIATGVISLYFSI